MGWFVYGLRMRRPKLVKRLGEVPDEVDALLAATVIGDVPVFCAALRIGCNLGGMVRDQREYSTFVLSSEELKAVNVMRRGWSMSGPRSTAEIMQVATARRRVGL